MSGRLPLILSLVVLMLVIANWLFVGWRPRFGMEAYFQEVIAQANVAEHFQGSRGRETDGVTADICDRVDASKLRQLGMSSVKRPSWPDGNPEDAVVWKVYQDEGRIPACLNGTRHLEIVIDQETSACTAKVNLWHTGCAL